MRKLVLLLGTLVVLSSCQNISITKRTYRPGFHVNKVGKKNQPDNRTDQMFTDDSGIDQYPDHSIPSLSASITDHVELDRNPDKVQVGHNLIDLRVLNEHTQRSPFDPETAFVNSVSQMQKETTVKAAIANANCNYAENENQEYNKLALAGFALGLGGVVFIILSFAFLVSYYTSNYSNGLNTPAAVGLIGGPLQALGGLFLGVKGSKLAKADGKRGKGLGITGWILGIIGVALSAIVGLVAAIGSAF